MSDVKNYTVYDIPPYREALCCTFAAVSDDRAIDFAAESFDMSKVEIYSGGYRNEKVWPKDDDDMSEEVNEMMKRELVTDWEV